MLSKVRSNGGQASAPRRRAEPDPGLDLVRPEDEVGRFDRRYIGHIVILRWIITLTYPAIVLLGLIPMHPLALLGSASWLAFTSVLATWYWFRRGPAPWYEASYLFLDSFSVTFGVMATANLSYPIWLAYVMLMIEASAERTTRFSLLFGVWCLALFVFSAGTLATVGWDAPSVGVVVVVSALIVFIGFDLTTTFAGGRRLRAYIRRLAVTDPLTGLVNRRRLFDLLARFDVRSGPLAVFVLDVDDFKTWNDSYGHLSGDQLLVKLARALELQFPNAMAISRYGGDEFVILDRRDPPAAASAADGLLLDLQRQEIRASIGFATVPHHEPSADAALAAADDCLRHAKRLGKSRVVTPDQEMVESGSPVSPASA